MASGVNSGRRESGVERGTKIECDGRCGSRASGLNLGIDVCLCTIRDASVHSELLWEWVHGLSILRDINDLSRFTRSSWQCASEGDHWAPPFAVGLHSQKGLIP